MIFLPLLFFYLHPIELEFQINLDLRYEEQVDINYIDSIWPNKTTF